jgi:hypothetical protein
MVVRDTPNTPAMAATGYGVVSEHGAGLGNVLRFHARRPTALAAAGEGGLQLGRPNDLPLELGESPGDGIQQPPLGGRGVDRRRNALRC